MAARCESSQCQMFKERPIRGAKLKINMRFWNGLVKPARAATTQRKQHHGRLSKTKGRNIAKCPSSPVESILSIAKFFGKRLSPWPLSAQPHTTEFCDNCHRRRNRKELQSVGGRARRAILLARAKQCAICLSVAIPHICQTS